LLTFSDLSLVLGITGIVGISIWRSGKDCRRIKRQKDEDRRREQDRYERPDDIDQPDIRIITTHIHAIAHQLNTQNNQQARQDIERAFREKVTMGALIIAGVSTFVSAVFLWVQLQDAKNVTRAVVTPNDFQATSVVDPIRPTINGGWDIGPMMKNSGTTPALNVIGQLSFCAAPFDHPMSKFPDLGDGTQKNSVPIGAGGAVSVSRVQISTLNLLLVQAGLLNINIWGWTRYEDVFGTDHETRFCYTLQKIDGDILSHSDVTKKTFSFTSCEDQTYSCTDRQCGPRPKIDTSGCVSGPWYDDAVKSISKNLRDRLDAANKAGQN
jgi:hypothetical protein